MVGEALGWGSDYFGGKVVPGAAAQPVEVQGEGSCWWVIQVGIMLLVLLSDLVRLREPISGYPTPQGAVHIALSDQYPDIRVRRELST